MKTQLLLILITLFTGACSVAQTTASAPSMPDYLAAYFQLKDVLYSGNTVKVKEAAFAMKNKISSAELADAKRMESIISALKAIEATDDIETQRTSFAKFSQYMISHLEENPVNGVTIYSDFCPMARNGKGAYWLSTDKEINNNPYMGDRMPHCGTLDQKIFR
ncbi:MAG: DUF3347 domain-containing protein [Chitinophagales bacterium]